MRFALLFVTVFSLAAHAVDKESLIGSYKGCGESKVLGKRGATFNLVKMQQFNEYTKEVKDIYTASFRWANHTGGGLYFPKVNFDKDNTKMYMMLEINPKVEHGKIVNTLVIDVQPDGTLTGSYATNSMSKDDLLLEGVFEVAKEGSGTTITCK